MIFFPGRDSHPTPHLMQVPGDFRPLTCLKVALTALPTVWRRSSLIRIPG